MMSTSTGPGAAPRPTTRFLTIQEGAVGVGESLPHESESRQDACWGREQPRRFTLAQADFRPFFGPSAFSNLDRPVAVRRLRGARGSHCPVESDGSGAGGFAASPSSA
jgi:hypothetical protein